MCEKWQAQRHLENMSDIEEQREELKKQRGEIEKIHNELDKRNLQLNKIKRDLELQETKFKRFCENEKNRLKRENDLLEAKIKKLETELFNLAVEKEKLSNDRQRLEIERGSLNSMSICYEDAGKIFFYGAMDEEEIKNRYRSLIKIYHPDNAQAGNNNIAIRIINYEYERLRGIHRSLNSYR